MVISPNSPGRKPSPRYTNLAYRTGVDKPRPKTLVWKKSDEGYLIREYNEFNDTPKREYKTFLKQVGYTLMKSDYQIRMRLKEMSRKGFIEKRKH